MTQQRFSGSGVVSSMSLVAALGCAGLLGIEEATCDPSFDPSCDPTQFVAPNQAAGAAGAAVGAAGSASAPAGAGGALGSAGTSSAGAGGSAEEPPLAPLCDRYCDTVAAACTGQFEQYASRDACLAVCESLDAGSPTDPTGNTIECRLARAEFAQTTGEPQDYCFSAGPGGAGQCGTDCEGFCTIMAKTCTLMGSYDQCLPQCAEVPDLSGPPDNVTYDTSIQAGDSIQCRLFHVTAATLDSVSHCAHAAGVALCANDNPNR